jgi:ATP-binding cassette, subfamily C, bacterial LapB
LIVLIQSCWELPAVIDPRADASSETKPNGASRGEHVMAAFARLKIDPAKMTVRACALNDLVDETMPCVVVFYRHVGIALTQSLGDGRFLTLDETGSGEITLNDLAPHYSGKILGLVRLERAQHGVGAQDPNLQDPNSHESKAGESAQPLSSRYIIRHIIGSVLRTKSFKLMSLAAITANFFVFALPIYSMAIYDRIIPHRATETLVALTLGILLILGVDLFCRNMRGRLQEAIGIRSSLDLQWVLFQRILKSDVTRTPRSASILQSAFGAVESACLMAPALIVGFLVDLPFLIFTLIYTAILAQWVVIPSILAILAVMGANIIAYLRSTRAYATSSKSLIERQNLLEETVEGLAGVKVLGTEPQLAARYGAVIDEMAYHGYEGRHESTRAGHIANTIIQASTVASLVIGVFLINAGAMTVGALVAAILLTGRAISPVSLLAAQSVRAASLYASMQYAAIIDHLPQEEVGDQNAPRSALTGAIRLAHVSLRYPGEPRAALNDVSFSVLPGERIGLIGRIGCGKSSLIQLLPRLLTPESGTILLDEHDIRQYDPVWLRRQIAYMPQDCELVEGTIRHNILRGLEDVDPDLFREATQISGVHEIIASHPKGYALEVGRRTRQLSGGERQAVCLARTLVRNAPILVMDEPTSAMDNQLESAVVTRLRDYVKDRTLVIATHRAPLLALVDRVIWLEDGRVVADGPREQVIARVSRKSA